MLLLDLYAGLNIVINGRDIESQLLIAKTAYTKGDGITFGHAIGVILDEIIVGKEKHTAMETVPTEMKERDVIVGLLEGFGSQFPALDKCVGGYIMS